MNFALVVALVLSRAEGKTRLSGADVMPRGVLGCVRLKGAASTIERLRETALADILAEEEVRAALGEPIDWIRNLSAVVEAVTKMKREEFTRAFGGELTVAVVGFEGNAPRGCLALELSEGREELEKLLDVARILLAPAGWTQYIHRGYTIETAPRQRMVLCYTFVKNFFLVATGRAEIEAAIACALGDREALSSRAEFATVRKRLGDPDLLLFIPVTELLKRMIPERDMQGVRLLGLDGLRTFAASVEVSGKEFVEKACILAPERAGVLRLLELRATNLPALKHAPFDAFAYAAVRLSPGELLDGLKDLATRAGRGQRAERGVQKAGELLGRELNEFLDLFSGELQLHAIRPPGAGLVPDLVLMAELLRPDDVAATLEALVKAVEERGRPKLARASYRGVRFYAVQGEGGRRAPISPCFAVVGDFAILTLGSQAAKRLIARFQAPGLGLSENPRFAGAAERLPRGKAGLFYMDLPELVNFAYSTLVPLADNRPRLGDLRVRGLDLPLPEVITAHLTPVVAAVCQEGEVVFAELHSPVPVSVPLALAAFGVAEKRRAVKAPPEGEDFEEGEDIF